MSWSLNEIEGLCRKAARGAGMSWGLAEEAGKATRWLACLGLPGPKALAGLLMQNDAAEYQTLRPVVTDTAWTAEGGQLCPLIAGAAMCDQARQLAATGEIALGHTFYPLLLIPFAGGIAAQTDRAIQISWCGTRALVKPDGATGFEQDDTLDTSFAEEVRVHIAAASPKTPMPQVSRADIPEDTAKTLTRFAHRTYAPATPESRLAGAGAGLTDND